MESKKFLFFFVAQVVFFLKRPGINGRKSEVSRTDEILALNAMAAFAPTR